MNTRQHGAPGSLRLFRGCVLTLAMLCLTTAVHTQAHGDLPSAGSLLVITPLLFVLSALFLSRKRDHVVLIAFTVGTQALLHVLLTVGAGHGTQHDSLLPSTAMLLGHIGAAVVTALVLARGEATLNRWIEMVRTALLCGFTLSLPVRSAVSELIDDVRAILPSHDLDHAIHRRGPPIVI